MLKFNNNMYALLHAESPSLAERLTYVDFKLLFTGILQRTELMSQFSISNALASQILSAYREYRPNNMTHDRSAHANTLRRNTFQSLVDIDAHTALHMLAHGFDKNHFVTQPLCKSATLSYPTAQLDAKAVSRITRAIFQQYAISADVKYPHGGVNCLFFPLAIVEENEWLIFGYNSTLLRYEHLPLSALSKIDEHSDIQPNEAEGAMFIADQLPNPASCTFAQSLSSVGALV